jgi:adenylosuccinate lyase
VTAGFFAQTFLGEVTTTPEMDAIFDEGALLQDWLDVEAALAQAQAEHGIVPGPAAATIQANARLERLDLPALFAEIRRINHPLVPLIQQLAARCGEAGGFVHWGATTQDVVDTGLVLALKRAWVVLRRDLRELIRTLADRASEHRETLMVARTHGQHALPTTFGFKLAVVVAELLRHHGRMDELAPRLFVGQLGGAVGTLAGFGPAAMEVQRATLRRLGLACPEIAWHTARDGLAELVAWTGMLGATLGKLGHELATLQRTEIGEVAEPFPAGFVGSSTMPHKRNPIRTEGVDAAATLLRENVASMLAAMRHEHERDGAPWTVELACVPRAACLAGAALAVMLDVARGFTVDPVRMRRNLDLTGGMILSEAVMLDLGCSLGRQEAHDLVYRASMRAHEGELPFRDALIAEGAAPEAIRGGVSRPEAYIGLAPQFVDRIVALVKRMS